MSCEGWEKCQFSDIVNYKTGKLDSNQSEEEGQYPFFTCAPKPLRINSYSFDQDAILLAGNNANGVFHLSRYNGRFDAYQRTYVISSRNNRIVNNDFLYYQLALKLNMLKDVSLGTATRFLTKRILDKIVLIIPPFKDMAAIAATLSCIDDKIELNNRMNDTLEQMAQAIFKSWFVDYEPFQDGEFEDSELGKIPKGWKVGIVEDLGDVVGGSTPSKKCDEYYDEGDIPWITPKDLSVNKNKFISCGNVNITNLGLKKSSAQLLPRGTVLFSSRAPIGYIAIAKNELSTNQGFKSIVPKKNVGTMYIYHFLKNNLEMIEGRASGSTFKEISGSTMKKLSVLLPPEKVLNCFEYACKLYFAQIESLEAENSTLTSLRDTLLPKMMSGEIRVPVESAE